MQKENISDRAIIFGNKFTKWELMTFTPPPPPPPFSAKLKLNDLRFLRSPEVKEVASSDALMSTEYLQIKN